MPWSVRLAHLAFAGRTGCITHEQQQIGLVVFPRNCALSAIQVVEETFAYEREALVCEPSLERSARSSTKREHEHREDDENGNGPGAKVERRVHPKSPIRDDALHQPLREHLEAQRHQHREEPERETVPEPTHVADAAQRPRGHDLHAAEELKQRRDAEERDGELEHRGFVREEARDAESTPKAIYEGMKPHTKERGSRTTAPSLPMAPRIGKMNGLSASTLGQRTPRWPRSASPGAPESSHSDPRPALAVAGPVHLDDVL